MPPPSVFALAGRRSVVILLAGVLLSTLSLCASQTPAVKPRGNTADPAVRWQPTRPVNGSPVVFRVTSPAGLKSLSGKWLEHEVSFSPDSQGKVWYGFAGASLETLSGNHPIELKGTTTTGKVLLFQKRVAVGRGRYHSIVASVPKKYTEPSAEQLQEIGQDKTLKERTFSQATPEREWAGSFHAPAKAQISDVFGTSRTFNGCVQSVHQGLDYAVPEGTPVVALNSGTVLLARPLFFECNCVVLDHGQGLLTLYMHLSKIEIKEGERIASGEKIGLSGATGRATGPHLHVAVRWQGVYLDPATLLSLKLP
jgi:murein DD-endopeptidase MepM/ murein hydrolase activator NlpD